MFELESRRIEFEFPDWNSVDSLLRSRFVSFQDVFVEVVKNRSVDAELLVADVVTLFVGADVEIGKVFFRFRFLSFLRLRFFLRFRRLRRLLRNFRLRFPIDFIQVVL